MCSSGNMPAQATANSVMASAKRLIELRQVCLSSSRMAEISVPAWPIPIHHTKLMMAKPQATGISMPQMPTPAQEQIGDGRASACASKPMPMARPSQPAQADRPLQHGIGDLVGDRVVGLPRQHYRRLVRPRLQAERFFPLVPAASLTGLRLFKFRVRVLHHRHVGGARTRVQVFQQAVVALLRLDLRHAAVLDRSDRRRRSRPPGTPAGRR